MDSLLQEISTGKYKKIIVMAGAGISTAAGIPDFRTPGTGLYSNLQRFNLPFPEAVFDLEYLRDNPEPFFMLASEMYPTHFEPTSFHDFIAWIAELGYLKRVYTQNIDTLERKAGIDLDLIVEAHGSFSGNHCIDCNAEAENAEVESIIINDKSIPRCKDCDGIVKPDIVFFGESLPDRFHQLMETDFDDVDLAIVAGTSLQVSPFNQLPMMVPKGIPRYLINKEKVGNLGSRKNDVLILGSLEDHNVVFSKFVKVDKKEESQSTSEIEESVSVTEGTSSVVDTAERTESESLSEKPDSEAKEKELTEDADYDGSDIESEDEDGDEDADERSGFITSLLKKLRVV